MSSAKQSRMWYHQPLNPKQAAYAWAPDTAAPSHYMHRTWASSTRKRHALWNWKYHRTCNINIQHMRKNLKSIQFALLVDKGQNKTEGVWPHMGSGQAKYGRLFYEASSPMISQKNETCLPITSYIPRGTPNRTIFSIRKQRERVCYSSKSGAHCAHIIPTSSITLSPGTSKYGCCTSDKNTNRSLIDLP